MPPPQSRSWLNTTEKDPERFREQVQTVCETYLEVPAWEKDPQTHTVCIDEMTGLQALERNAPTQAMAPKQLRADRVRNPRGTGR